MKCESCKTELTDSDILATFATHDDNFIDIVITCPECDLKINIFADIRDGVRY